MQPTENSKIIADGYTQSDFEADTFMLEVLRDKIKDGSKLFNERPIQPQIAEIELRLKKYDLLF